MKAEEMKTLDSLSPESTESKAKLQTAEDHKHCLRLLLIFECPGRARKRNMNCPGKSCGLVIQMSTDFRDLKRKD